MNRITEITKRDMYDVFKYGVDVDDIFIPRKIHYCYHGRLDEIDFLKRLYDLENMPSNDSRYKNALEDIKQHTVNNNDFEDCWVFEDERFQLNNENDEIYLKFLCEIFHPLVRNDKGSWKEFLKVINRLLQNDGYELYSAKKISNRDVYGWRIFDSNENIFFIPYSQRNKEEIKTKKIDFSIKMNVRKQIAKTIEKYDFSYQKETETGFNYNTTVAKEVFNELGGFYIPKCYRNNQYTEAGSLEELVLSGSPYHVFDVIELFGRNCGIDDYEKEINMMLKLNKIPFKIENQKMANTYEYQINDIKFKNVQEVGLKELLQEASGYYEKKNYKIAVEKLWDAFERLKTYYSPEMDKKASINKIVEDMSKGNQNFNQLFEKEFIELKNIGNSYRIRHHETTKIEIEDERYYKYFYKRCLSLIYIATEFLEDRVIK